MRNSTPRFIVAALLIAAAAIFLHARAGSEVFPPRLELKQFPTQLGSWTGTDIPIEPNILDILRPSDYLLRIYQNPQKTQYIDLFIPYFLSQRAGEAPHSPQHCLPGSGWTPLENRRITLAMPGHEPFPANRYLIAKGDSRQLVQLLSGQRFHQDEPERRFPSAGHYPSLPRRDRRRRAAAPSSLHRRSGASPRSVHSALMRFPLTNV